MNPEISVVIPAYNASAYIADAIKSVQEQTFTQWQLIVVDDGSTDNTSEIIKGYLSDSRIKLIKQENKGVSAARNAGIKEAQGKYITFLDADDYYLPYNLQRKHEYLQSKAEADFVYSDVMQCDDKLNDRRVEKGVDAYNLFTKVMLWQGETIPTLPSNVMVKAALMKEKFLFDEYLSNCADRYMKILLSKNATGAYVPEVLVKYRDSPGSMSKKIWLLEKDEKYIIRQIRKKNIVPSGSFRRRVIANIYLIISGSWYVNAHRPLKAIWFGLKAICTYPPIIDKVLGKASKQLRP